MKGLINALGDLKSRIMAATAATADTLIDLRKNIATIRGQLSDLESKPLPRAELILHTQQYIDLAVARFIEKEGPTLVRTLGAPRDTPRLPQYMSDNDFFNVLLLSAARDAVPSFVAKLEYEEGIPSAQRPALIEGLKQDLARLEVEDEKLVDDICDTGRATGTGITAHHRPEVLQRREAESRKRQLSEQNELDRAARESQINRRHAERRRGVPSPYLSRG